MRRFPENFGSKGRVPGRVADPEHLAPDRVGPRARNAAEDAPRPFEVGRVAERVQQVADLGSK